MSTQLERTDINPHACLNTFKGGEALIRQACNVLGYAFLIDKYRASEQAQHQYHSLCAALEQLGIKPFSVESILEYQDQIIEHHKPKRIRKGRKLRNSSFWSFLGTFFFGNSLFGGFSDMG